VISATEKKTIAFHEAGHAIVSWLLRYASPLMKVSIIPRGKSLGAAWYLPHERQITTTDQIFHEMCAAMGGRYQAAPRLLPLGMILTFISGEAYLNNQLTIACPASWKAIVFFSVAEITRDLFSKPPTILSTDSLKSEWLTDFLLFLAANKAASLQTLAISAPLNPGVCLERISISTVLSV
jgi:hypothetical protein